MKYPTAFLILALASGSALAAEPEVLTGKPKVVDGDTLMFGDREVRLDGIDAPDREQTCIALKREREVFPCGLLSARKLASMVIHRKVTCEGSETDAEGRLWATCKVGRADLAYQMVETGWAFAHPERGAAFERSQRSAQALKDGMWKGSFVMPWEWRAGKGRE